VTGISLDAVNGHHVYIAQTETNGRIVVHKLALVASKEIRPPHPQEQSMEGPTHWWPPVVCEIPEPDEAVPTVTGDVMLTAQTSEPKGSCEEQADVVEKKVEPETGATGSGEPKNEAAPWSQTQTGATGSGEPKNEAAPWSQTQTKTTDASGASSNGWGEVHAPQPWTRGGANRWSNVNVTSTNNQWKQKGEY